MSARPLSPRTRVPLRGLAWAVLGLAGLHVLVGLGVAVAGNPEGWLGGVFYALSYAIPLVLIALALRSTRTRLHAVAGWGALLLAACYTLIVIGNWSGYSSQMMVLSVCITAPTVALDLVIFWTTVVRRHQPGTDLTAS